MLAASQALLTWMTGPAALRLGPAAAALAGLVGLVHLILLTMSARTGPIGQASELAVRALVVGPPLAVLVVVPLMWGNRLAAISIPALLPQVGPVLAAVWAATLLAARAEKDGDSYLLNGLKWYTSSADGAAFTIAMMVTNPDASPAMRASMFIVPMNTPGVKIVRNIPIMGHAGDDYNSHSEVLFENVRIPKENLLGREGGGFKLAQERLGPGRIHHCMRWLGISARAFDMMCRYANKRVIHNDGGTLADSQITQFYVAELAAELHAARLMTLSAAWAIENLGMSKARDEVAMIKFVVANTMNKIIDRALQIHGGLGMADDTILAYFFRHERAARIYDGADEVHKSSLGKRILRDYRR